jgi:hypothetical protein
MEGGDVVDDDVAMMERRWEVGEKLDGSGKYYRGSGRGMVVCLKISQKQIYIEQLLQLPSTD